MSIMDELKKLTRPYDDDSSLIDDDMDMDLEEATAYSRPVAAPQPTPAPVAAPVEPIVMNNAPMSGMTGMNTTMNTTVEAPRTVGASMGIAADITKYRVILVQPEKFDCATAIATHIRKGNAVVLNCENTDKDVARRVVDFLSGCAFALDGSIRKAANNVYILVPRDVGVDQAEDEDDEA